MRYFQTGQVALDRDDVGNFLNLPYYDAEEGLRYAIKKDDGTSATLEEFFELYESISRHLNSLSSSDNRRPETSNMKDGLPCLQFLIKNKISEVDATTACLT